MTAYNYDTQNWVEGEAGTKLRLAQLQETLALATGPRGEEYAKFSGVASRAGLVANLERGIAECQTELARLAGNALLAEVLGVN